MYVQYYATITDDCATPTSILHKLKWTVYVQYYATITDDCATPTSILHKLMWTVYAQYVRVPVCNCANRLMVIVQTWWVILQQWLVIVQHWLEQQAAAAVCVLVTNIPSLCTDTICGQKVSSLTHPAHEVRGCVWSSSFLMLQLNWGHKDAINEHSLPTSHLICGTPYMTIRCMYCV